MILKTQICCIMFKLSNAKELFLLEGIALFRGHQGVTRNYYGA